MQTRPDEILKAPYSRVLIPEEDGTFSSEILEFPGCFAQGKTADEAFGNLEKAAKVWIEASLAQGLNIPSPAINHNYSGKIALRIPRSLHKRASQMAARDATSLNQFLVAAIASRVGAEEYHSYLFDNLKDVLTCTILDTFLVKNTFHRNVVNYQPLYIEVNFDQSKVLEFAPDLLSGITYKDTEVKNYQLNGATRLELV